MPDDTAAKPVRLTREELYQLAWQTPMRHLAAEFGISDTGLKKICRRLGVPCPPLGWWAKKAAGKSVRVTPLPAAKPGTRLQVTISPTPARHSVGLADAIEQGSGSLGDIPVPERLVRPHVLIASWIAEHRERQDHAREFRRSWPQADYKVPELSQAERRRHRVLQALFRALEQRGAIIKQDDRRHLFAVISGERIEFSCHEKSRYVTRPLTADEKRWRSSHSSGVTKELEPTGRLEFQIRTWIDQPFKKLWLESERQSIETMLPEIVATFLALAPVLAERTRVGREQARLWAERQREQELQRQRQVRDDNRWARFLEIAEASKRAQLARELIEALRRVELLDGEPIDGRSVAEWLDWAEARMRDFDPRERGLDAIFRDVANIQA